MQIAIIKPKTSPIPLTAGYGPEKGREIPQNHATNKQFAEIII
jgi:hypothetical protein